MSAFDSVLNVLSVFSPSTAFGQGEKASGAFDMADSVINSDLGKSAGGLISKIPGGDLALSIADFGYNASKSASKLGGKDGGFSLFNGLFD